MSSPFIFVLFLFCFVSSVFFACKGWLIRFSGRGGGGGGLFASNEDVFFSCEFTVQDFFFGCITFAGIFFNATLGLFLCI